MVMIKCHLEKNQRKEKVMSENIPEEVLVDSEAAKYDYPDAKFCMFCGFPLDKEVGFIYKHPTWGCDYEQVEKDRWVKK